jgi:hypothetical protein
LVDERITDFINAHNGFFTAYNANNKYWTDEGAKGEIVGRFTVDGDIKTLAISRKALSRWVSERGVDSRQITLYARQTGIEEKAVKLTQNGKATLCLIIPTSESNDLNVELLRQIIENPRKAN